MSTEGWRTSLHGGHSFPFCDHALGSLEESLEMAAELGLTVYGIAEHAPRMDERYLYPTERNRHWSTGTLLALFEEYAETSAELARRFSDRLTVLRGFETEVVPEDRWIALTREWRGRLGFDYVVGAVHHIEGQLVDGPAHAFDAAADALGGTEAVVVAYYQRVAEMIEAVRPEVVAHLDLVRTHAARRGLAPTPDVRAAEDAALDAVQRFGGLLEVNTLPLRRGEDAPYPAPSLLERARDRGLAFCLADDSHEPGEVGDGLDEARAYLLAHGVEAVAVLLPGPDGLRRELRPLR